MGKKRSERQPRKGFSADLDLATKLALESDRGCVIIELAAPRAASKRDQVFD
jgi:hypothetical protein